MPDISKVLGTDTFWTELKERPAELARRICEVDVADLHGTLQRHSALRAWINAAHETAKIHEERCKWKLTRVRARVRFEIKEDPDLDARTVADLDAAVELHPDVVSATDTYLDAGGVRAALRAMSDAMEDRKDMLIQISANMRREYYDQS